MEPASLAELWFIGITAAISLSNCEATYGAGDAAAGSSGVPRGTKGYGAYYTSMVPTLWRRTALWCSELCRGTQTQRLTAANCVTSAHCLHNKTHCTRAEFQSTPENMFWLKYCGQASPHVVLRCANILYITVEAWKNCLQNKSAYSINNKCT